MSESNRGRVGGAALGASFTLALALGAFFWWQASTEESAAQIEAHEYAADQADAARISVGPECGIAELSEADCAEEAESEARPDQRNEYDLEAQRTMAAWTKAMGMAALIGMCVGIFGLGLIYTTFRETRRQAEIARHNLDALYEAERAIVHAQSGDVGELSETGHQTVAIEFKNKGRASARIVEIGADGPEGFEGTNEAARWCIIAPGESETIAAFAPPEKDQILKVDCWVRYRSVGPQIYTSYFSAKVSWYEPDRGGPVVTFSRWFVEITNKNGHPDDT